MREEDEKLVQELMSFDWSRESAIREAIARTRKETLLDAAKKQCWRCAAGEPLVNLSKGYISNFGDFAGGAIHYPVEDSNSCYEVCESSLLRKMAEEKE